MTHERKSLTLPLMLLLALPLYSCGDGNPSHDRPSDGMDTMTDNDGGLTDSATVSDTTSSADGTDTQASTDSLDSDSDTDTVTEDPDAGADGDAGLIGDAGPNDDLLVDDFEDGDHISLLEGFWYAYTDEGDNGASTLTASRDDDEELTMTGEGYRSALSLYLEYTLDQGGYEYDPFVGWGVTMGTDADAPYDLSGFDGVSYVFKGSAHLFQVETYDVEDYDYYLVTVPASAEWKRVEVPFGDLRQAGWGTAVDFQPDNVGNISWQVKGTTGDAGELWLDDVALMRTIVDDNDGTPDMVIREPNPPTDDPIASIAIANPLQALAEASLNKGYNLTNWLEDQTFTDFSEYNEQFVINLATAGFKALRLPIDLDRYIADRATYFTGETPFAVDPRLFTVLDAFDEWTLAHGLSLSIDYHQYDESFDLSDPLYVDAMVSLWASISEHFAANPRTDLFFELMNEPEQSAGTGSVDADDWTAFAEQLITGIRLYDTTRAILFGDVQWYGISTLAQRTPFADTNIIYVFHFYEPFLFTHQGASWTDMGSLENIPYPYATDRWSEYYDDFGVDPESQSSWVISMVDNYYRDGNRSALRNQVLEAKQWAVDNNVPVICNEFGAYDRSSRIEDRVNYYTDIVGIFEELAIPWQLWFMMMDPTTGEIDPAIKAALGL